MANEQRSSTGPWILEAMPFIVVLLIAAHVFALVLSNSDFCFVFLHCIQALYSVVCSFPLDFCRYIGFISWQPKNNLRGGRHTEILYDSFLKETLVKPNSLIIASLMLRRRSQKPCNDVSL